jgi:hypothetical protein
MITVAVQIQLPYSQTPKFLARLPKSVHNPMGGGGGGGGGEEMKRRPAALVIAFDGWREWGRKRGGGANVSLY